MQQSDSDEPKNESMSDREVLGIKKLKCKREAEKVVRKILEDLQRLQGRTPHSRQRDHPSVTTGNISKEERNSKTLMWLDENFVRCPGVCLPRCILYAHYLEFCMESSFRVACAATFGKLLRQKFPHLTTRRLGTRGNSKYHYYGIAIKESSKYYHRICSGSGLTRFSGSHLQGDKDKQMMSTAKTAILLPELAELFKLQPSSVVDSSKLQTFLLMYKTHCQCILDTAVSGNLNEIHNYLDHFWTGIPQHLHGLVTSSEVIQIICFCDSIMYKVMNNVLVPFTLDGLSETLFTEVRHFAGSIEEWTKNSVRHFNSSLSEAKFSVAHRFSQSIKRQMSFLHLAQSFKDVFADNVLVKSLLDELREIDIKSMEAQSLFTTFDCNKMQADLHEQFLNELKDLLQNEATVDEYVSWLEGIFQNQVVQQCHPFTKQQFKVRAQEFLLSWSFFGTRVMHSLTLNNSRTYGPFHLARLMLDEYILLVIESQFHKQEENELQELVDGLMTENASQSVRVSTIVAKSRFGAPTKESKQHFKQPPPLVHCGQTNELHQASPSAAFWTSLLPNDSFARKYGLSLCPQLDSSIALTPPSSPQNRQQPYSASSSDESLSFSGRSVEEERGVDRLVDEHFRNSGVDGYTGSTSDRSMLLSDGAQKLLNKDVSPYAVNEDCYLPAQSEDDEDQTPLQLSFSQLLGNDLCFNDCLTSSCNSQVGMSPRSNCTQEFIPLLPMALTQPTLSAMMEQLTSLTNDSYMGDTYLQLGMPCADDSLGFPKI